MTNLNNHYRDKLFGVLREHFNFDFVFYSDGGEPYWMGEVAPVSHLGTKYLKGFWVGRTRIVPALLTTLVRSNHEVIVCTAGGKFVLPLVWLMTRSRNRRLVLWTGVWQRPRFLFHRVVGPVVDWLYRNADAVVAYGAHVRTALLRVGVLPERIRLAPQAIDNSRFDVAVPQAAISSFRSSVGIRPTDVAIVYVGRLVPSKGVATLLRAIADGRFNELPVVLLIVGSGPEEDALRSAARRLGIESRVRFIGSRPNVELPTIYQSADIVVVPSEPSREGAEPWGLVVNEAMASGVAVIASDAVGAAAHGLPADGRSGVVFHAGDSKALAASLAVLVTDENFRLQIRAEAQRHVSSFTYEGMADGIVDAVKYADRRPKIRHDKIAANENTSAD